MEGSANEFQISLSLFCYRNKIRNVNYIFTGDGCYSGFGLAPNGDASVNLSATLACCFVWV